MQSLHWFDSWSGLIARSVIGQGINTPELHQHQNVQHPNTNFPKRINILILNFKFASVSTWKQSLKDVK